MAILSAWNSPAWGQALTYVDADDLGGNFGPLSAVNSGGNVNNDVLWGFRAFGAANTIFESGIAEDSPTLNQTLTGLTPGKSYDLYGVFWTDKDENWTMRAGTTAGNMTLHSWRGPTPAFGVPDSQRGVTAGAAVWAVPPPPTAEGTVFTQRPADPLVMLLAKAGTASASGAGTLDVFIDDRGAGSVAGTRTWFDGVAYVDAGTTIAMTATINRLTGALTIANPTAQPFQIKAITLDSPSGALKTDQWTPISGRLDANGNSSFDTHVWNTTPPATMPFAVQLAEAEDPAGGSSGGTLVSGGGSIGLGNLWTATPAEDVRVSLTLADDSLVLISPTYTGGASIASGDFNGSGAIDLADFQVLLANLHTDVSALTPAGSYLRGDINGDRSMNFNDFTAFRTAYDAANGAGAFEQIASAVPEPATLTMAAAFGLAWALRRRRLAVVACTFALALTIVGRAEADLLLAVDVNDRSEPESADPVADTAPGFQPMQIVVPGETAAQPEFTSMVGGYTVTMTAVDSAGNPLGALDDRDRATPTTAPMFNQLYDDFVFAGTGVGIGGGLDLMISGGSILPNTQYNFSLYAFDTGSTAAPQPRTSNWMDGNNSDALLFTSSFSGANSPIEDDQYKYTAGVRSDATGKLFLKARNTLADASPAVFVNGFLVEDFEVIVPIELTLEVNTTTGNLRFVNEQTVPFDANYYEIRSAAGSLNPAWAGLDGGEGGDPVGTGWDKAGGSTTNILSEVNLTGISTFDPGASATLGNGFMPGGTEDLTFSYAAPDGLLSMGIVKYVTGGGGNPADFNGDGMVNAADLAKWRADFGANAGSDADGDGDSDGNDFLIWQRNLGAPGAGGNLAAVPEPSSLALAVLVGGVLVGKRRRR
jgi:hypothetical protein